MGVLNLVIVIITVIVAGIACVFAGRTYRSQLRSEMLQARTTAIQEETEKIQHETYDSQLRAEQLQKRATEIQDRMDARDLAFRKSQARGSLTRLIQQVRNAHNSIINQDVSSPEAMKELMEKTTGFWDCLIYLPECNLTNSARGALGAIAVPPDGVNSAQYNRTITDELTRLATDLTVKPLIEECRQIIENMK